MVFKTYKKMGLINVKSINYYPITYVALLILTTTLLLLPMCAPPAETQVEATPSLTEAELKKRDRDCAIAMSNGSEYYKNRDFVSAVRNYRRAVDLGCGEEYASELYLWFGRAYNEIGNTDSAVWAFQQGLRYLPEDKDLLENIAYSVGRLGDTERQTYYYERLIEVDPKNTEAFGTLADLLREQERHDDLIQVLIQWLEADPTNGRVQSELIAAYEVAGKDPLSFMRRRWEDSPDNVQWGIDYAQKLIENLDYAQAYRTLESIIQRSPSAREAYQLTANTALDEGDIDRAILAFEQLFALNRTDFRTAQELSRALLRNGDYPRALEWAETAVRTSNSGGEALYIRAEVYYTAADDCVASRDNGLSNFQDKLVFNMAYDDYRSATDNGYRRARTRADFLEKNLIPSKGDWFLQPADLRVFKPQGNCYSWITRSVRRS